MLFLPGDQVAGFRIDQIGVRQGDARRRIGHRRIDIDLERKQALAANQAGQHVEDFLRPADGEGRDDQVAACRPGALEGGDDLVFRLGQRTVPAVAIGRFDQQHVGRRWRRFRIVEHRPVGHAEVAGKHQPARLAFAGNGHFEPG